MTPFYWFATMLFAGVLLALAGFIYLQPYGLCRSRRWQRLGHWVELSGWGVLTIAVFAGTFLR